VLIQGVKAFIEALVIPTSIIVSLLKDYIILLITKMFKITLIRHLMREWEIQIIKNILTKLKPRKCLEWGSGYSTVYFPKIAGCKWISIEHDQIWFAKIKKLLEHALWKSIYKQQFLGSTPYCSQNPIQDTS
jgi:hypothetical protein